MFFELSKLLNLFLSPISWIILLLIGVFLIKNRSRRKGCLISCIVVFALFTNTLLVDYVKYQTVRKYNTPSFNTTKIYKLAIVMGGFASINQETGQMRYEQDRADRLWEAVRLWKEGKVERILITGDPTSITQPDGSSTAKLFLNYMEKIGVPPEAFVLEQQARNTQENAAYTAQMLKEMKLQDKDCLLVTSVTHMERSLKCFAKQERHPDYLSVNTYDRPTNINHRAFYPEWKAAMKWQELMNEWIGDLTYRMMGYI